LRVLDALKGGDSSKLPDFAICSAAQPGTADFHSSVEGSAWISISVYPRIRRTAIGAFERVKISITAFAPKRQ
jgi:hypothetical protein